MMPWEEVGKTGTMGAVRFRSGLRMRDALLMSYAFLDSLAITNALFNFTRLNTQHSGLLTRVVCD